MKTFHTIAAFLTASSLSFLPSSAFSEEESYTQAVEANAECRKTHDGGCTAWATLEIQAKDGYHFSINSIEIDTLFRQHCTKIQYLHQYPNGSVSVDTLYGALPFASKITLRAACESGSGIGGLNQVSKMSWGGTIIANRIN
jgi:hypothetical protein